MDDVIKTLASNEYYVVKKNIHKLLDNHEFMEKIVKVHNPIVFDRFVKMCEYKIDTSSLYEERNNFIKETVLRLNSNNIYRFFDVENLNELEKEKIAHRYLNEYIINYCFGDNYYNFMTNFYQMVHYLKRVHKPLVDDEHLQLYSEFIDLKDLSIEEKIAFFKKYLKNNLMEMFYDDISIVREDSHKSLTDASLKLHHDSEIYCKDVSRRLGIDVYVLDGEEFFGFVRSLSLARSDLSNNFDYVNSNINRLGYSFSYIGNNNIGTIDYENKSVVLFYDSINYQDIMYVHHGDLHAKRMTMQDDFLSEKENEILTPSSLIGNTNNYNEVFIKSHDDGIKPTALVCYDNITGNDIAFAEKYGLALLLIKKAKYKRYETYDDDYDSYTYVI